MTSTMLPLQSPRRTETLISPPLFQETLSGTSVTRKISQDRVRLDDKIIRAGTQQLFHHVIRELRPANKKWKYTVVKDTWRPATSEKNTTKNPHDNKHTQNMNPIASLAVHACVSAARVLGSLTESGKPEVQARHPRLEKAPSPWSELIARSRNLWISDAKYRTTRRLALRMKMKSQMCLQSLTLLHNTTAVTPSPSCGSPHLRYTTHRRPTDHLHRNDVKPFVIGLLLHTCKDFWCHLLPHCSHSSAPLAKPL